MKRKFFSFVSLCLSLLILLSAVPVFGAESQKQAEPPAVTEPNCCNETVFLKGLILNAISEEKESLDVSDFSLTAEEAETVLLDVVSENANSVSRLVDYRILDDENGLILCFEYGEAAISFFATRSNRSEIEKEKQRILSCVEESMSDMEKALVVHDYMALNYAYDETYSIYSADGMFEHKTGVCQAYAEAFKEIMTELDIPCQIATSRNMNHAWNLVKIDGEWYHVDVTWDDPTPDMMGRVRHVFFLLSDDAISDPYYYRRPHYDWVASNDADSDRFDGYFWYDVDSVIVATQGNWYYILPDDSSFDSSGCIMKKNIATGRETKLYEIDSVWNLWNEEDVFWIGCFSGLGFYNDRLYFNTTERIKSINLSGTGVKTVYTPDTSEGYIYGFVMNGTTITYGLSKSVENGIESTGRCTVSGTSIVDVSDVSLNQTSAALLVGETMTLRATVTPNNATNKKVYWSSSNPKVATVDENGVITAKDAGKTTIKVTTDDGNYTDSCRVTVTHDLRVMIEGDSAVAQGKTITLNATAYYEKDGSIVKTKDPIEWRSSNPSVATVSDGKVKGVSIGQTTITATIEDSNISASFRVDVVAPITSLKFASSKMTAYVGNRFALLYELNIAPSEHTDTILWTSSDETVARVNQYGVVTPLATGKVKITATAVAGKKKATVTVTVARKPESIDVVDSAAVAQGKTITLKAYAFYEENGKTVKTKDTISWESLNEDIATVSKGKVKGINAGTATIRAFIAGSDVYKDIEVNVAVPVKKLKLATTKQTLYVDHAFDLSEGMTVEPFGNTDTITWTSSNEDIAIVDEDGVVTPLATGKVKITALAEAGKKKATCTVTVAREPEGIDVVDSAAVAQGKTITLKAYAFYEENGKTVKTKDVISWESSDEDIATVSKGKIKGISAGTAIIRAYIAGSDVYEEIEINVVVPVKKLKLACTKQTLYVGIAFDLSEGMTVEPFGHTDEIIWTSSNEDIAIVDENGVVTPLATGKVKITAKATAGKKSASVTITVK